MESASYTDYQKKKFEDFESLCMQCGECCGSKDGDPCECLRKNSDGKLFCSAYGERFGPRSTMSGRVFNCVPIREMISRGNLRPNCAYNIFL